MHIHRPLATNRHTSQRHQQSTYDTSTIERSLSALDLAADYSTTNTTQLPLVSSVAPAAQVLQNARINCFNSGYPSTGLYNPEHCSAYPDNDVNYSDAEMIDHRLNDPAVDHIDTCRNVDSDSEVSDIVYKDSSDGSGIHMLSQKCNKILPTVFIFVRCIVICLWKFVRWFIPQNITGASEEALASKVKYEERLKIVSPHHDPKRYREDSVVTSYNDMRCNYGDVPFLLNAYIQVFFNISLASIVVYMILVFVFALRHDIHSKVELSVLQATQESLSCAAEYQRNKCFPVERVPAMETSCSQWETCMQRDAGKLSQRSTLSAQTVGETINAFLEQLSWKSAGLLASGFLIVFVGSNVAFSLVRPSYYDYNDSVSIARKTKTQ